MRTLHIGAVSDEVVSVWESDLAVGTYFFSGGILASRDILFTIQPPLMLKCTYSVKTHICKMCIYVQNALQNVHIRAKRIFAKCAYSCKLKYHLSGVGGGDTGLPQSYLGSHYLTTEAE